ncbi:aspartate carbamoyltransferase catalytic subunit [Sulfobacillus thermosulfidooxidans]|uniref:aspartate carbamoyltransferase catalytic subunit n=1 Tax=Sulfobacillus thermosulfidooxidans TaxID=28034 RepID=UPI00096BAB12|nr:aspartate carbamoyltransferase catalytic subunit [Sulfobacillus thermosulfidooxidans]OLZ09783.1 aspartate carbamoyltransferase [Sulfobacillus thermosulfidooxidans]OLZ15910.1 aspartate carbamoyltransferase [Sulfobacillus thermosulfidooxidans]OLZ18242.1 aspartate carbamoyltransferase [Sulfobacillus thermosulfidooxidans]
MHDLLTLESLSEQDIVDLLDLAQNMVEILDRPIKKVPTLRGKSIVNLFFEPSTRTRNSFELAAKYLSADVINVQKSGSSVEKGETLWDTARNLSQMAVDAVIIRHQVSGVPQQLAEILDIPVINAGDGSHEHPTQGLLDTLTLRQAKGHVAGLKVAIVGDVLHSRVARSDIWALLALGARVSIVGPPSLLPSTYEELGVEVTTDLKEALEDADAIQVLRLQKERQSTGEIPSLWEYRLRWGITRKTLQYAKPDAVVLHPGPQNRGVEIDSDVLDSSRSYILQQVRNGVAVRMAVLFRLLGGGHDE